MKCSTETGTSRCEPPTTKMRRIRAVFYLRKWFRQTCSVAAQSSSCVLPVDCFELLPIICTKSKCSLDRGSAILRVSCFIYIWIIINSKDQNSQVTVTWKCSIKWFSSLGWIGSLWASKSVSSKARDDKVIGKQTWVQMLVGVTIATYMVSLLFLDVSEEICIEYGFWLISSRYFCSVLSCRYA